MQGQPDNVELYLMIKAIYDGQQMRKASEDTKRFSQEAKSANDGFRQSIREHTAGFDNVRFAVSRAGLVYASTLGLAVGLMTEASKKTAEVNRLSKELGVSVAQASREYLGIQVSDEDVLRTQRLSAEWEKMKTSVTGVAVGAGNFLSAQLDDAVKNWRDINILAKSYNDELEKMNKQKDGFLGSISRQMDILYSAFSNDPQAKNVRNNAERAGFKEIQSTDAEVNKNAQEAQDLATKLDGQRKLFVMRQEMLKLNGQEIQAYREARSQELRMLSGYSDEVKAKHAELTDFKLQMLEREKWGFKTAIQEMRSMQQKFGQDVSKMFGDVFIDGLDNKLANSRQIFSSFFMDLRNQIIRFAMNQAVAKIFGMFVGAINPVAGLAVSASSSIPHRASGGWVGVNGPEIALVGERGPEYVTSNSDLGKNVTVMPNDSNSNSGKQENNTTVTYYINAVDAASFASLVSRNPESIVAVTSQAIMNNKSLRRTIKDFA
jgi:hypothetical protein